MFHSPRCSSRFALKRFFRSRVYLKTGEMTGSEGFFVLSKPFFHRNTCCISRENGAAQGKKTR